MLISNHGPTSTTLPPRTRKYLSHLILSLNTNVVTHLLAVNRHGLLG